MHLKKHFFNSDFYKRTIIKLVNHWKKDGK